MKCLTVAEAISSRMSVRAFAKAPVAHETLKGILNLAARAPSGTNTQPWKVYVLQELEPNRKKFDLPGNKPLDAFKKQK